MPADGFPASVDRVVAASRQNAGPFSSDVPDGGSLPRSRYGLPREDPRPPGERHRVFRSATGAFVLDADGAVEKAKLNEFRPNNLSLKKQLDELTKRYDVRWHLPGIGENLASRESDAGRRKASEGGPIGKVGREANQSRLDRNPKAGQGRRPTRRDFRGSPR